MAVGTKSLIRPDWLRTGCSTQSTVLISSGIDISFRTVVTASFSLVPSGWGCIIIYITRHTYSKHLAPQNTKSSIPQSFSLVHSIHPLTHTCTHRFHHHLTAYTPVPPAPPLQGCKSQWRSSKHTIFVSDSSTRHLSPGTAHRDNSGGRADRA